MNLPALRSLCLGLAFATGAQAAPVLPQQLACLIQPSRIAEIGTPVTGVIEEMRVERGDSVKKGQVIAVLRGDVERAALNVAQSRAQADADVQAAIAALEFARQSTLRAEDLVKRQFVSAQALDKARTEEKVAAQKLAQAREQRQIWTREQGLAQSQLAQRTIVSPLNGIVAERYLSAGERIEERSLARVVSIHPLHVEVMVPASQFGTLKPGQIARVTPDLPGMTAVEARIILVDKLIDSASNTFRVRLELPNPDHAIPAGPRCKVAFAEPAAGPTRSSAATSPATAPRTEANVARAAAATLPLPGVQQASLRTVAPAPAAGAVVSPAVAEALERWRKAWENRDLTGYLAAYAGSYKGEHATRADWLRQRETRLQNAGPLAIRLSGVTFRPLADRQVRVEFHQQYQSPGYRDDTRKTLLMVQAQGQWLIGEERAMP